MTATDLTVLCADADAAERRTTADALEAAGYDVLTAATVAVVEDAIAPTVDCVVTAFDFPDGDAYDVVATVRAANPDLPVVVFSDAAATDLPRPPDGQLVMEYLSKATPGARERLVGLVAQATTPNYQVAYPVPADERERVAAIRAYDVASSEATATFDRLTKLVANHFDIDVAFVGIVDEHEERFVACEGANWETLTREDSICTHTILEADTMVVEDVREDPRFASNDRLVELDIRSYAGVRLTTADGHAIGALCCTDDEPRQYTEGELADLRRFAAEVEEQLRLRRQLREREGPIS